MAGAPQAMRSHYTRKWNSPLLLKACHKNTVVCLQVSSALICFKSRRKKKSYSCPVLLNLFQMRALRRKTLQDLLCWANWFLLWREACMGTGGRKIYGTWHKRFGFCLEKDSGCFWVLSYSLGVFEEAEVSSTSTHSLCGLFIQLLLPGLVPVKDALLGSVARKPCFINNSPGETGVITDVLSGSRAAFST